MIKPREHLLKVAPCPHGSFSNREGKERGITAGAVIDFSASCNPLGASPRALAAIRTIDPSRYPDDEAMELRSALAGILGVETGWVIAGNGSVELIYQLAAAYLEPGDRALIAGPTFGEYERACRVAGAEILEVRAVEEDGFRPDIEALTRAIREGRPKLAFLCNPNNPTGQLIPTPDIERLIEACDGTLLVVDEAYLPFCAAHCHPERSEGSSSQAIPFDLGSRSFADSQDSKRVQDEIHGNLWNELLASGRLLLLRSLTKDCGLAGLRLGYAVAPPDLLDPIRRVRPPWTVNAAAQAAGLAALEDKAHLDEARRVVIESRSYLARELSSLGLGIVPSSTNFMLVRTGDGAAFRSVLLEYGICVRDCASFGLPAYVRIAMRTLPECEKLVNAAREVLLRA